MEAIRSAVPFHWNRKNFLVFGQEMIKRLENRSKIKGGGFCISFLSVNDHCIRTYLCALIRLI